MALHQYCYLKITNKKRDHQGYSMHYKQQTTNTVSGESATDLFLYLNFFCHNVHLLQLQVLPAPVVGRPAAMDDLFLVFKTDKTPLACPVYVGLRLSALVHCHCLASISTVAGTTSSIF